MNIQDIYGILVDKLTSWAEAAVAGLPNLVVAVAVLALFVVAGRLTSGLVRRIAKEVSEAEAIVRLMTRLTRYAIVVLGFIVALGILGLQKTVFSVLAGAGVVGLAIGFAFQDLAANFIAGIVMGLRKPFDVGDIIRTNDHMGTVRAINLRNTLLETFSGQLVIVPNKEVFENPLVNYSAEGLRRVEIEVGVAYDSDLERAAAIVREAVEHLDFLAPDTDVTVVAEEFGGSSINFTVRYWIEYPGEVGYPAARHAGIVAIKKAFDEHEIDIPFPIRTLDFSLTEDTAARFYMERAKEPSAVAA